MSAEQIPGQMTTTAAEIRSALAEVDNPQTDREIFRPLARIEAAAEMVRLAEQLLREQIADARAMRDPKLRAVMTEVGMIEEGPRGKSPTQQVYSWEVIASVLTQAGMKMTGERARQIYGR